MNNRKFVSLSKLDQKRLANDFGELRQWVDSGELESYGQLSISVFDHWLSANEARAELGGISENRQRSHNKKLHSFVSELTSQTECYLVKFTGRRRENMTFRKFTSATARNQFLTPAPFDISNRWRFTLVFPELEAIYFERCDFTHDVFFREHGKLRKLEKAAQDAGVYAL
ncbi:MAG: hypothetical protein V7752_16365 [Halopseudomonas sp.]